MYSFAAEYEFSVNVYIVVYHCLRQRLILPATLWIISIISISISIISVISVSGDGQIDFIPAQSPAAAAAEKASASESSVSSESSCKRRPEYAK
jgi:hypothetical protein